MEHMNALPAGTRLGEYEIETDLGAGGFGITYKAYDTHLNTVVAIKEYLPRDFATRTNTRTVVPTSQSDRADYDWGLARFLDEARTLARFKHPHINQVYRFFEAHGTAYLVLEYIEGETLSAVLARQQTLSQAQVERLLREVLSGLEEVHAAGFVHRDIKPGNLMIQPDGSAVVLDFGAARQAVGQRSKSVTSILTPGYAPLEQYDTKAEDVGPWSDIYALGMVAYRCISGLSDKELPDAVTRSRNQRKGQGDLAPAETVGKRQYAKQLLQAIDQAIEVHEEERPQSIAVWRQSLPAAVSAGVLSPLPGAGGAEERKAEKDTKMKQPSPPRSSRWAVVAGVVALVVAVAGGAYVYFQPEGLRFSRLGEMASGPAVTESDRVESQPGGPVPETGGETGEGEGEIETEIEGEGEERVDAGGPSAAEVESGLGLAREDRVLVQRGLGALEYAPGPADGAFGPSTRQALEQWQTDKGYAATGYLVRGQADTLMELGRDVVQVGAFVVETEPADAAVELLGVEETYRPGLELPVGRYQVEVSAAGYESRRVWVEHQESGGPYQVALEAIRQPFTITPEPADAQVRILNIPEQYQAGMALAAGEYRVEVSAEGYRTQTETITHGPEPTERRIALERTGRQVGETFRDCPTCPQMVVVPAGSYRMGSPSSEEGRGGSEGPVHRVTIGQPFAVGVHEVTVGEYGRFVGATGHAGGNSCYTLEGGSVEERSGRNWRSPGFRQTEREPVVCVNWADARAYVRWLSQQTGQPYRLLSEAEWEYVARAGSTTAFHFGGTISTSQANYNGHYTYGGGRQGQYRQRTVAVGSFAPNAFGLYDVHGNAWEWTQDCWNGNYQGAPRNGRAWERGDCSRRVLRGGAWNNEPRYLRSAIRDRLTTVDRSSSLGFRLARSLP